jgi:hypothetical protein
MRSAIRWGVSTGAGCMLRSDWPSPLTTRADGNWLVSRCSSRSARNDGSGQLFPLTHFPPHAEANTTTDLDPSSERCLTRFRNFHEPRIDRAPPRSRSPPHLPLRWPCNDGSLLVRQFLNFAKVVTGRHGALFDGMQSTHREWRISTPALTMLDFLLHLRGPSGKFGNVAADALWLVLRQCGIDACRSPCHSVAVSFLDAQERLLD